MAELLFCCQQKVVYNLMDHPVCPRFCARPKTIPLVRCGAFLLRFCCSFTPLKESITAILQFCYLKSAAKLLCLKAPLSCCSFKAQNAARSHRT